MILNTSGGGASLNFKVIGDSKQPETPSENTIWVNTSTTISNWIFSSQTPDSPTPGMVWFVIGDISTTPINALKINGIELYPTAVKQYNGSSWVDKVAKCYQNGGWVTIYVPKLYIFKSGTGTVKPLDIYFTEGMSVRVSTDYIEVKITGAGQSICVTTQESIKLSNYSKLRAKVNCDSINSSYTTALAFFSKRSTSYSNSGVIAGVPFKKDTNQTYTVNVPSGTTSAYVGLNGAFTAKIYDIWLE